MKATADTLLTSTEGPLLGRAEELKKLDELLASARSGGSFAIVIRGEPGIGKSALLEHLAMTASDFQVARAVGIEGEADLPYAGLHQLCRPMTDTISVLPQPQAEALAVAFGLASGPAPDRLLVGLAALTLMSELAAEKPLLCVVDDAQWVDSPTIQALAFVARRLGADSVGLVLASRDPVDGLGGVPELHLLGLGATDAAALLDSVLVGRPMDGHVRERLLAETHGNPLALVELPLALTPADAYGGLLTTQSSASSRVEESFKRRLEQLPADTRLLMVVAAAEPVGDPLLLRRAAARLELKAEAADPAEDAGLLEIRERYAFRHPLVRSAAYRSASTADRRMAHSALADVTDAQHDPDRKAWHRAHASAEPDEEVAAELERSAARAKARGGLGAAGAFLERAALLTPDEAQRASRMLAAAELLFEAGAYDPVLGILQAVDNAQLGELDVARALRLRGLALRARNGKDKESGVILIAAAERFVGLDPTLARRVQLEAWHTVYFLGDPQLIAQITNLMADSPAAEADPALELIVRGIVATEQQGVLRGYAVRNEAARVLCTQRDFNEADVTSQEGTEAGTFSLWDFDTWEKLSRRTLAAARERGSTTRVLHALGRWVEVSCVTGAFSAAESAQSELSAIAEATGNAIDTDVSVALLAWRRAEPEALKQIGTAEATRHPHPDWQFGRALLFNAAGRYEDALGAAQSSCALHPLGVYSRALPELVEAAVRCGDRETAEHALQQTIERADIIAAPWGLGLKARAAALVSEDPQEAEDLYEEAIEHLTAARTRPDLARAHLLYGEWLRREGRRTDARDQLRKAYDLLGEMGTTLFEDRVRQELRATGETARKRTNETRADLTAQESQIAQLAADGLRNSEIAAKLFLSVRTVEWHLRRIYPKLGIASRRELRDALA